MGFWDSVKSIFGGGGGGGLEAKVRAEMQKLAASKTSFTVVDISNNLGGQWLQDVEPLVEKLFHAGALAQFNYRRLDRLNEISVYNPYSGISPGDTSAPPPTAVPVAAPPPAPAQNTARPAAAPPPKPKGPEKYASNPEILGLSAEELRKRAVKVKPYQTAWIGRVDTIPPQSDDRTAYIDRGLILRGLLTEQQIAEIHEVGDQWLRHSEAANLAKSAAAKSADAAIDALKAEKEAARQAKKAEAKARLQQRREAIAQRRQSDIIFLGRGVSRGLADRRANVERLSAQGLPVLTSPKDVADALGLSISKLRWLCFHSEAAETVHYVAFEVPKKSGGVRRIAAPQQTLAAAQQWVLHNVLEKLPLHERAHGFVRGRSTVTNAREHVGKGVVVNVDLKDFFPTITFPRVLGVFRQLGYSPAAATVLALLCTEAPRRQATYAGKPYHVAVGPRALPQGACTSPAISNLISRRLDARLNGRATKLGWHYTRYADDLTFSREPFGREGVGFLLAMIRHVAQEEGFALNPKKGRVQVDAGQQTVTGLVVNDKVAVPRVDRKRLRAILHQAKKTGLEAQNREQHPNFRQYLQGMIAYVSMVDATHGAKLQAQLDAVR